MRRNKTGRIRRDANGAPLPVGREIRQDIGKASSIYGKTLDQGPLTRVDASRSQEVADMLSQFRTLSDPTSSAYVGRRSGDLGNYLARLKDSTLGYDSAENNALREQRRRETERGFQSGRATLARGQNNYRLGATQRAAQLAELARNYGQQSTDAEVDLFAKNADEKQKRLQTYGDTLNTIENQEYTRSTSALNNYRDTLGTARADEFAKEKINLGQEVADKAAKTAGILGILEILSGRRNAREQNQLIREGYQSNERISNANRSNSNNNTNGYLEGLQKLIDEYSTPQQ